MDYIYNIEFDRLIDKINIARKVNSIGFGKLDYLIKSKRNTKIKDGREKWLEGNKAIMGKKKLGFHIFP